MRELKFRCWNGETMISPDYIDRKGMAHWKENSIPTCSVKIMQFTEVKDKNGTDIYDGDILEFSDKWEWYKGSYGIKMHFAEGENLARLKKQYEEEPMERRVIELPANYEFLLSDEIQKYWEVVGNINQNPELLNP